MSDSNQDKKILITGANGFVGSYLVRLLRHKGYLNLFCGKRKDSQPGMLATQFPDIRWVDCDLTEFEEMEHLVMQSDIIFHCAAVVSFQKKDKKSLTKVNIEGTRQLVNLALRHGIKRFIHISSIAAIGRSEDERHITEDTQFRYTKMDTRYGTSKFLAEMEVWRAHSEGLPISILNPSLIIGSGNWKKGTCRIIQRVYNGVSCYPAGSTGIVDVRDVARMAVMLLEKNAIGERYICSGKNETHKAFLQQLSIYLGVPKPKFKLTKLLIAFAWRCEGIRTFLSGESPLADRQALAISREHFSYSNEKSKTELAFEYIPLDQTLREISSQILKHPEGELQPIMLPLIEQELNL